MAPQAAVQISDPVRRKGLRKALDAAKIGSDLKIVVVLEIGATLNNTLLTPKLADIEVGDFRTAPNGAMVPWAVAGLAMNRVDTNTEYHISEGIMAVVGEGIAANCGNTPISADQVKVRLLELAGLQMQDRSDLAAIETVAA